MSTDQLTLAEGLRDGAMLSAAGLAWFTGSKIVAGAVAVAFAASLYDDWRNERNASALNSGVGERQEETESEEWQCPECGAWNYVYRVDS